MPSIDVTGLLFDQDIAGQTFDVIRTTATLIHGVNQLAVQTIPGVIGSVTPASSDDLLRLPDLERVSGTIIVMTTFPLIDIDAAGHSADKIVYPSGGTHVYTLDLLDDYMQFGAGYNKATCRLQILT